MKRAIRFPVGLVVLALAAMPFAACDDGGTSESCEGLVDLCDVPSAVQCGPDNASVQTCAPGVGVCFQWSTPVPCPAGQACANGVCQCKNECANEGDTECLVSTVRTCTAGDNGCLVWVSTQDCLLTGQRCDESTGTARCVTGGCTDACDDYGDKRCEGEVLQTCAVGSNGCLNWVTQRDCASIGQHCLLLGGRARCMLPCEDDCDPVDFPACSDDDQSIERCVLQSDGCYDVESTACLANRECRMVAGAPSCELECGGDCTLGDTRCRTDGRAVETCREQVGGCNVWEPTTVCTFGESCQNFGGVDVCAPCTGSCVGRECGPDGCDGSCGTCPVGETCDATGHCVGCVPECAGRECGTDGCGGLCGSCEPDQQCDAAGQCQDICQEAVADGSFEGGTPNPSWDEASTNFNTPLCSPDSCGSTGAHSGIWWAWFGGIDEELEDGSVAQVIDLPADNVITLRFFFLASSQANLAEEYFEAVLDDQVLFRVDGTQVAAWDEYTEVVLDLTSFSDGGPHNLEFRSHTNSPTDQPTNFYLDDVSIEACAEPACTDECAVAAYPACSADGLAVETCADTDQDGCSELASTACEGGQVCQGAVGAAACVTGCLHECDPLAGTHPACSGEELQTCELQADTCYDLVTTPCEAGQTCQGAAGAAQCMAGCLDECDPLAGTHPACSGADLQTCELQADTCYDLVTTPCEVGQVCQGEAGSAACALTCVDECDPLAGTHPVCSGADLQTCELQADSCHDVITSACPGGQTCQGVAGSALCVTLTGTGETCADPLDATAVPVQLMGADFSGSFMDDHDFSGTGCDTASGADLVVQLDAAAGEIIHVSEAGALDAVLRVLGACNGSAECLLSSDFDEDVLFAAPADGTYYVVVESWGATDHGDYAILVEKLQPICTPGETRCSQDGRAVEACDALGVLWELDEACAYGCEDAGGAACLPQPLVVLNEVFYNPGGTDTTEFVELFGVPGTPLDGYSLVHWNGSGSGEIWSLDLAGVAIPVDGFWVLGAPEVVGVDLTFSDAGVDPNDQDALQNGPDNVVLFWHYGQADQAVVDALGYGTFAPTDDFAGESLPAAGAAYNTSLVRHGDGFDTGDNSVDFPSACFPSPGQPNLLVQPAGAYTRSGLDPAAPLAIPDDDPIGVDAPLDLTGAAYLPPVVSSLQVAVYITHPYRGDLWVSLRSPAGTVVELHRGSGSSADDLLAGYDWVTPVEDLTLDLSAFQGEDPHGVWVLNASDHAATDEGALQNYVLYIQ